MKRWAGSFLLLFLSACGGPPKPTVPALNPEQAYQLLRFDPRASKWLDYVRTNNTSCDFRVQLPDQASQPTEIDLDQVIWCGAAAAPREYSARAIFTYDATTGKWKLDRFLS